MSSPYTSFSLVGAGGAIGQHILGAFLAKNAQVIVLTRSSGGKTFSPGVEVKEVAAYDDVKAVTSALQSHKVDVLISALNRDALDYQIPLAAAAKAAGVKLIAASEYGVEGVKEKFIDYFKSIGLPSLRVYNGLFTSILPFVLSYHLNKKFNIVGNGEHPLSLTADSDIAGFLVHVLTTLPPDELHDRVFRIEGERVGLPELATSFDTEIVDLAKSGVADQVPDFVKNVILKRFAEGTASPLYDFEAGKKVEKSDNELWAGHEWKKAKEVLKL